MISNRSKLLVSAAIGLAFSLSFGFANAETYKAQKPMPIREMAKDFDTASARMSTNGKYIAALVHIEGQENPVVRVWETADMTKEPRQFGSKTMRFYSLRFIKDDQLLLFANQPVVMGAKSDWVDKAVISDIDGKNMIDIVSEDAENTRDEDRIIGISLYNSLPLEPDNVLLEVTRFSGTDIWKANIRNGTVRKHARTGEDENFEWSDPKGNIRIKSRLTVANGIYYKNYSFKNNEDKWIDLPALKQALNDRYTLDVQHVSNDGKTLFVITDKDTNYAVVKKFDIASQTFTETVAAHTDYDITGISFGSAKDEFHQASDDIRQICFGGPIEECQGKDEDDNRVENLIRSTFEGKGENSAPLGVASNVKDGGKKVLFSINAPNLPPTYYYLQDEEKLVKVGSYRDGWDQSNLGEGMWVEYKARDGLIIPGILTLPPGYDKNKHGRIPLVVLPHGGPWSRDHLDFDSSFWPQMFATRGFAVLQPNYRGSEGLGKNLWKAGDKQWGLKMQDDNDDGAKWLVEQGIADPDRMMLYGYSYGGFAAAAAATRSGSLSKGLWQCAISGAPAIDIVRIKEDWGSTRLARKLQGDTVDGWNPAAHLAEVQIPWLIVHGSYDHQADILHSTDAAAKMKSVNPSAKFRFVQIEKMSHTLNKMTPQHKEQLMGEILSWTANNCGNISKSFDDSEAEKMVKKYSK